MSNSINYPTSIGPLSLLIGWIRRASAKLLSPLRAKPQQPNIKQAFDTAQRLASDFNDLCFYIGQIPKTNPGVITELEKYMEKADYALCSTRDELQIIYRSNEEYRRVRPR